MKFLALHLTRAVGGGLPRPPGYVAPVHTPPGQPGLDPGEVAPAPPPAPWVPAPGTPDRATP